MLYSLRNILRLCRIQCVLQNKRLTHFRVTNITVDNKESAKNNEDFKSLLKKYHEKITFNSYLEHEKLELGYFKYYLKSMKRAKIEASKQHKEKSLPPLPTILQYYVEKDKLLKADQQREKVETKEKVFQLPFAGTTPIEVQNDVDSRDEPQLKASNKQTSFNSNEPEFDQSNVDKWMTSYEYYDDTDTEPTNDQWLKRYGTPDPSIGISQVQCGGCGALLHCSEPSIPGYLPSEILRGRTDEELKTIECQRCHFLREYNIALDVSVQPEEYEKLLQSIR